MILTLLAKYWQYVLTTLIVAGLVAALGITRTTLETRTADLATSEANLLSFKADVLTKTAEAHAADLVHVDQIKTADDKIKDDTNNALSKKLAAANALASKYADSLRSASAASPGSIRDTGVPASASAPGPIAGPSTGTELPQDVLSEDARTCARNTVIAQGWQDWWKQVSAVKDR